MIPDDRARSTQRRCGTIRTKVVTSLPNQANPNMSNQYLEMEEQIVNMLRTVYDPEIPVNIYDLGLIYNVDIDDNKFVTITMTLTAPNCPAADFIIEDTRMKVEYVEGVTGVEINLTFEPEWSKDMMSEEALLELGFL